MILAEDELLSYVNQRFDMLNGMLSMCDDLPGSTTKKISGLCVICDLVIASFRAQMLSLDRAKHHILDVTEKIYSLLAQEITV